MKDIHSHILFGIDDGSETLNESIKLIKQAVDNGYTDLILTPHYRKNQGFTSSNEKKRKIFDILQQEVIRKNMGVKLYLGNEITLDDDLLYYLDADLVTSLNDSKYLLLELPFRSKISNKKLEEIIDELNHRGYKIIIAHPERYRAYRSLDDFTKLIDKGVYFQGNIESLYGKWGNEAQKVLEDMLKRHMIHFIGSDIHHSNQKSYTLKDELLSKLEQLTEDSEMVKDLVDRNIDKVIHNEDIKLYPVRQRRRRLRLIPTGGR